MVEGFAPTVQSQKGNAVLIVEASCNQRAVAGARVALDAQQRGRRLVRLS
jgi:hypothetical protein